MGNDSRENTLRERIAEEEKHLEELDGERQNALSRIHKLREQLNGRVAGTEVEILAQPNLSQGLTSSQKLTLFGHRFRGRQDVFAKRWPNSRTGRSGYAPACANDWVTGICEKPRIRCGECPNQAFLLVTDQVLRDHLFDRYVVGVYPLLLDETCWFLAVDFDGEAWQEDVTAFVETCRGFELAPSVERSRSGRGAHVWFFFAETVASTVARNLGCCLITETMSRRHQLPMTSYDRLFPSQNILPKGGFGNLIALPFQGDPRQAGNTLFLDEHLKPWNDQWGYLASTPRIELSSVDRIVGDVQGRGGILGVANEEELDEEITRPWKQRPSRRRTESRIAGPLPKRVQAVLAQRLFVETAGLPSPLVNRIKRLAAFQNPVFYKKQSLRLSTALTPRIVCCAEGLPKYVSLPRGCQTGLEELLEDHGVGLAIRDERVASEGPELSFEGELTPLQAVAAKAVLDSDTGVLVAPPGMGKTVVGAYLIAQRRLRTLVLVHRQPLAEQWRAQLALFLGIKEKQIGQIGAGRSKPNGCLDIAMFQSLVRKDSVRDLVADYGHVIVDECHHVPAVSFERVLNEVKARYIVGLTATPSRRDGQHPITRMQCGPVRYTVNQRDQANQRRFEHRLRIRKTLFGFEESVIEAGIQAVYGRMTVDENRNRLILDDVLLALEARRSPIVLTERRDHLDFLAAELDGFVRNLVVLRGGMSAKERQEAMRLLKELDDGEERLVLATGRYVGEGFDHSRLDTLFLTMPVSWKGTLTQYVGRLHRHHAGKLRVVVYDYVDTRVPMLARMFDRRLRTYRALGYKIDEHVAQRGLVLP